MALFSQERKKSLNKTKQQPLQIYFISPFQLNPEHYVYECLCGVCVCVCVSLNICMEMCLLLLQAFVEVDSGDVRTGLSYPFLQIFFQPANTHRATKRWSSIIKRQPSKTTLDID